MPEKNNGPDSAAEKLGLIGKIVFYSGTLVTELAVATHIIIDPESPSQDAWLNPVGGVSIGIAAAGAVLAVIGWAAKS